MNITQHIYCDHCDISWMIVVTKMDNHDITKNSDYCTA